MPNYFDEENFIVHLDKDTKWKICLSDELGIHVFDTDNSHELQSKLLPSNTVEENKTKFSDMDIISG